MLSTTLNDQSALLAVEAAMLGEIEFLYKRTLKQSKCKNRAGMLAAKLMLLNIIHENIICGVQASLRDLYYQICPYFKLTQAYSDRLVREIANDTRCSRPSLKIIPASRGLMAGQLVFRGQCIGLSENSEISIECLENSENYNPASGLLTLSIPGDFTPDDISFASGTYVLIIEKDAVFQRIVHETYACRHCVDDPDRRITCRHRLTLWQKLHLICVTACGFPDFATRAFVQCLVNKFKMTPIGLVDYNPHGLRVLTTYRGSLAEDSHAQPQITKKVAIPKIDVRWIGVHGKDIYWEIIKKQRDKSHLPVMQLSPRDRSVLHGLLNDPSVPLAWKKDISQYMTVFKAEIQSLYSHSMKNLPNILSSVNRAHRSHAIAGSSLHSFLFYLERQITCRLYL